MPTSKDLEFALSEATKRKGAQVELPWGDAKTYVLTVVLPVQPAGSEPLWSLYQGEELTSAMWKHASRDMALIHSLVFQSVPDDMAASSNFASSSLASTQPLPVAGGLQGASVGDASKASLSGRIENMQMATLVQSIEMSKMSGRLYLGDQGNSAQIYFLDGAPVHAVTAECTGDLAVIETMTWESGDFRFFPEETTADRTVKRRLGGMVMEGITLLDQRKFLEGQGLTPEAYLRKEPNIGPEEFKQRLSKGAPIELSVQKAFWDLIDNRSRLQDILQRRPLGKPEWMPVLFNLVSCGLVTVSEQSPLSGRAAGLTGVPIDPAMVQNVVRSLCRAETAMFTYPAFLFLLEQEFAKSVILGMPLSIIIFEARVAGEIPQPLPIPALREVANRIQQIKRPFDVLAHYETFDFALLVPGAPARSARMLGNRIAEVLTSGPLVQGQPGRLLLAGGIASSPEDTQDLAKLIAAAREAKNKAKEQRAPVRAFAEIVEQKH